MELEEAAGYACDLLNAIPKKSTIRIVGHVDADGIASASIVAIAVARAGYRFHVVIKRTEPNLIQELNSNDYALTIFSDIGSSYLDEMINIQTSVIVLDHHISCETVPSNVMLINARSYGLDGSKEACGASVAYAFARALNSKNSDLSELAIAGIIGDKQNFAGYNKKILEESISCGIVKLQNEFQFSGKNLQEALETSIEPYFTNLSHATKFIEDLGLLPQTVFNNLEESEQITLLSALTLKLIEQGVKNVAWNSLIYHGKKFGNLAELASKLNACARFNEPGLGVALSMGDKLSQERSHTIWERYRDEIRKELRSIETKKPIQKNHFLYMHVDKPSLSGVLAGLALNYLPQFMKNKPVFALATTDNYIDISARADDQMVKNGFNLGKAISIAAEKVGGKGGGHPIAAGGKIPIKKEQDFLQMLDEALEI